MANVYEYVTTAPQNAQYANLGEAVGFTGLKSDLEGDGLTLLAPKNDLLSKANIPMVYRWNDALTKDLLTNHVAANTAKLTASSDDLEVLSKQKLDIAQNQAGDITVAGKKVDLKKEEAGKYLVYELDGVLIPTAQTGTDALDTDLLTAAAGRIGTYFSTYATGTFYDALKVLNDDASTSLFSADLGYTVFLPEKDAWTSLTDEVKDKVGTKEYLEDKGLDTALKAHITKGTAQVTDKTFKSLDDDDIVVKIPDVTIAGAGAKILNTVAANFKNGQAHNIDTVLQFPRKTTVEIAAATDAVSTLVQLVTDYKLVDALNAATRSTIFAPTNDALNALVTYATWNTIDITETVMTDILKHHVIGNKRVYSSQLPASGNLADKPLDGQDINVADITANVNTVDVIGTNGNIHIINAPLVPANQAQKIPAVSTVVDIAKDTSITSTLYKYLALFPEVVETLKKVAPKTSFTVFAPNDEAFKALTAADLDYLTANDNEKLKEVLLYHVVPSAALSQSLEAKNEFPTVLDANTKLVVESADDVVTVGSGAAKVVGADVKSINGVVHVIDQVLVPESVVLPSSLPSSAGSVSLSFAAMFVASVCVAVF